MMIRRKTVPLLMSTCTTAMMFLGATSVSAGEVTGNGQDLKPLSGNSACAYSGLQDDYEADIGFFRHELTQSWGQVFKEIRDAIKAGDGHPGYSCNPTRAAGEP